MKRLLLNFLNAPLLFLLAVVLTGLQTSLFAAWPFNLVQPDFLLILVVWCALRRGFIEGGILTLLLAHLAELHSGAPRGLYYASDLVVFVGIQALHRWLMIPNFSSYATLTLGASMVWKLVNLGILYLLGTAENQWKHTLLFLMPGAVIEGTLAFFVFPWLEKFDWVTFKNPRAEKAIEEELELDLEGT